MGPSCTSTSVGAGDRYNKVCFHWRTGRCNHHPCPYLHSEIPNSLDVAASSKRAPHQKPSQGQVWRNPNIAVGIGGLQSKLGKGHVRPAGHQKVITGIALPSARISCIQGARTIPFEFGIARLA